MRVPSFALLCCCCCTQAELTGSPFDNGHGVENHERIFYGEQTPESVDLNETQLRSDDLATLPGTFGLNQFKTADFHAAVDNVTDVSDDSSVNERGNDQHFDDNDHDNNEEDDVVNGKWTKAEQWGYAILANSCVVCLSLCGILIVKCTNGNNRRIIGDYFLGLVVSIMLGDSLLHIMPEVLGLHDHDHDHDDHEHDDDVHDDSEYYLVIAKMGTTLGTVYLFWFIQSLMSLTGCGHSHDHGHSHGHGEELGKVAPEPKAETSAKKIDDETNFRASVTDNGKSKILRMTLNPFLDETHFGTVGLRMTDHFGIADEPVPDEVGWTDEKTGPKWSVIGGLLFGDCCCNFTDGLAIGVAWTISWGAGLGTTLAIVLHELPHELGDFIVYKKLGLSTRMAVGLNLFAAMISFAGLFIGLALATETEAEEWLLALVAGLFIFIPMVNVVSKYGTNI